MSPHDSALPARKGNARHATLRSATGSNMSTSGAAGGPAAPRVLSLVAPQKAHYRVGLIVISEEPHISVGVQVSDQRLSDVIVTVQLATTPRCGECVFRITSRAVVVFCDKEHGAIRRRCPRRESQRLIAVEKHDFARMCIWWVIVVPVVEVARREVTARAAIIAVFDRLIAGVGAIVHGNALAGPVVDEDLELRESPERTVIGTVDCPGCHEISRNRRRIAAATTSTAPATILLRRAVLLVGKRSPCRDETLRTVQNKNRDGWRRVG